MRSEMTQAIMDAVNSAVSELSVAMPGKIVSYDSATGLCNVQPDGGIKKPDGTTMNLPIVAGVPIAQPAGIAVPVKGGVSCLLIVCDTDIAGWIAGKSGAYSLKHSLTNAVCIPGLQKTATSAQNLANSKNCVAISGNLYVDGQITSTGNCNAPNI